MEFPKVLVAGPTYNGMEYCDEKFISSLKALKYSNYDILIVDNSENEEYFNKLNQISGIITLRDNSNENRKMFRLINSRNKIIDYALENRYDYILMMDSDVIPPEGIISELLLCKKKLISGLYYNYFYIDGKSKLLPVAWMELSESEFQEIKKSIQLPDFVKDRYDLRAHMTLEEADSNKVLPVLIPSAGCLLISREVFSKVRYGLLDNSDKNNIKTTDDVYFIIKAKEKGFDSYCNTKIKCEHLISGKFKKNKEEYNHPLY